MQGTGLASSCSKAQPGFLAGTANSACRTAELPVVQSSWWWLGMPAAPAGDSVQRPCPTLYLAGTKRYCWRRVSTVEYLAATSTLTGSVRQARCSFWTLLVMVALNSWVVRSCRQWSSSVSLGPLAWLMPTLRRPSRHPSNQTQGTNLAQAAGSASSTAAMAHLGDGLEYLVDFLLKIHVQKPVCLIQHQVLQGLQAEPLQHQLKAQHGAPSARPHSWLAPVSSCEDAGGAAPAAALCLKAHLGVGEVVHHAPRGAHNDVGPLAQGNGLCHHVHAAHQHRALDADACPQGLKLLADLNGQLARGGQHQAK